MKPILFNTEMVRAILDGCKTVTRRVAKFPEGMTGHEPDIQNPTTPFLESSCGIKRSPYSVGDILYVRETWYYESHMHDRTEGKPDLSNGLYSHRYVFKASNPDYPVNDGVGQHGWRPSIHMPKSAARIFLRVTGVRVERLQEITVKDIEREGLYCDAPYTRDHFAYAPGMIIHWRSLWNSTLKPSDIVRFGWNSNPWVWVIEFERCEKPKEDA